MKRKNWKVGKYSIRPAGKPGECTYCKAKIGTQHKSGCVIKSKTVVLDIKIRIVEDVPEDWTKDDIEFHYNDGSYCLDNFLDVIEKQMKRTGLCLCDNSIVKHIRNANESDEENYKLYVKKLRS